MKRHSELSDSQYMEALDRWQEKHGDVFEEAEREWRYHKARQQMYNSKNKVGFFGKIKNLIKYILGRTQ